MLYVSHENTVGQFLAVFLSLCRISGQNIPPALNAHHVVGTWNKDKPGEGNLFEVKQTILSPGDVLQYTCIDTNRPHSTTLARLLNNGTFTPVVQSINHNFTSTACDPPTSLADENCMNITGYLNWEKAYYGRYCCTSSPFLNASLFLYSVNPVLQASGGVDLPSSGLQTSFTLICTVDLQPADVDILNTFTVNWKMHNIFTADNWLDVDRGEITHRIDQSNRSIHYRDVNDFVIARHAGEYQCFATTDAFIGRLESDIIAVTRQPSTTIKRNNSNVVDKLTLSQHQRVELTCEVLSYPPASAIWFELNRAIIDDKIPGVSLAISQSPTRDWATLSVNNVTGVFSDGDHLKCYAMRTGKLNNVTSFTEVQIELVESTPVVITSIAMKSFPETESTTTAILTTIATAITTKPERTTKRKTSTRETVQRPRLTFPPFKQTTGVDLIMDTTEVPIPQLTTMSTIWNDVVVIAAPAVISLAGMLLLTLLVLLIVLANGGTIMMLRKKADEETPGKKVEKKKTASRKACKKDEHKGIEKLSKFSWSALSGKETENETKRTEKDEK